MEETEPLHRSNKKGETARIERERERERDKELAAWLQGERGIQIVSTAGRRSPARISPPLSLTEYIAAAPFGLSWSTRCAARPSCNFNRSRGREGELSFVVVDGAAFREVKWERKREREREREKMMRVPQGNIIEQLWLRLGALRATRQRDDAVVRRSHKQKLLTGFMFIMMDDFKIRRVYTS